MITRKELAKMFDHTLLKPYATKEDFIKLCDEAKELGAAMVAINSVAVKFCKQQLEGTDIHVGAAISFPLGQTTLDIKLAETKQAIEDGADEIDWDYVKKEMESIVSICKENNVISKVIFENCYLEKDEIRQLAMIAKEVRPDYIKTSTGFGISGAMVEDVKLMKSVVGDSVKVKAAGGIRDWQLCKKMIEAGAQRIGTSSSFAILEGYDKEL